MVLSLGVYKCKVRDRAPLLAHLVVTSFPNVQIIRPPQNVSSTSTRTTCSANNAKSITWQKISVPKSVTPPEERQEISKGKYLSSTLDFYGQHEVKFNGHWECVITPKDPKGIILRKKFSVDIAINEKSVEEKHLENAIVANLRIKTDASTGQTRAHFDASKCDKATHFQMIVVWTESPTETKPRLPRIPCKCTRGDETNKCGDELAHYTTSALELEQPLLVGVVPLWESRTLRKEPRFYTANSGIVTIRSGSAKELAKKLSSSTVALLPYKKPDSKATCRVKNLEITRELTRPNQIKVTWLKPDIETTVGYYINKYAIRLRSVFFFST